MHVLLVGKDQQQAIAHLAVGEDALELGPGLVDPLPVGRVDDEDKALSKGARTGGGKRLSLGRRGGEAWRKARRDETRERRTCVPV
jgi:hypothetical protein